MADNKTKYEELSNGEKIEAKIKKIRPLFRQVDKEKKQFVEGLVYQLGVVTVTLERLVEEINSGDVLENFEQGSQHFKRENPAIKSYNATIKSYIAVSKQLLELLPITDAKQAGEELMNFVARPPGTSRK